MQVADYTVDYMLYCLHHKNKQEMLLSVSVNETFFLNPTQTVENRMNACGVVLESSGGSSTLACHGLVCVLSLK